MGFLNDGFIDMTLLLQSATPLFIALGGLFMTGSLYDIAATNKDYAIYPLILEASCILSFKGNIELSFAIHLSSFRNKQTNVNEYAKYAFYNTNVIVLQSFLIGLFVGLVGAFYCAINNSATKEMTIKIVVVSILSCVVTTFLFVISLLCAVELIEYFAFDSENFILPLLSSIIDYLIVRYLLNFTVFFDTLDTESTVFSGFLLLVIGGISLCFSLMTEITIPFQSLKILSFSFALSIISGYMVDIFSKKLKYLPITYPILAGMTASISFICLHRQFSTSRGRNLSLQSSQLTLLVLSGIISCGYLIAATFMDLISSFLFSMIFISIFMIQTFLLLLILEKIVKACNYENKDVSVVALPIITSISDFIAVLFLLFGASLMYSAEYLI